jgi:DNA-binding transcriptional MerR regulator
MKQAKRTRIGDLAQSLNVERFVIRFWEKEFSISSRRSAGGQRFYTKKDIDRFFLIKELLYTKKFTIAGAKQFMKTSKKALVDSVIPSPQTSIAQPTKLPLELTEQLLAIKAKLVQLQKNFSL